MTLPPVPPPGWYPDPKGDGGKRYWDGVAWSDVTLPPAESQAMPPLEMPSLERTPTKVVAGVAVAALAVWGITQLADGSHGGSRIGIGTRNVTYSVTSTGGSANNITYMVDGGQQQETSVSTPWSRILTVQGNQPLVINAQNGDSGSISCSITVDGNVISQHTSSGPYAVVMCNQ